MSEATGRERTHLAALGTGGSDDRLHFRLVLRLLLRCVRLLRPVRRHVVTLFSGFTALGLLLLPLGLTLFDAFWTRALQGQPLLPFEASLLRLDPARFVAVASLDVALRREVLAKVIVFGAVVGVAVTPIVMALYYYQVWILQRVNQILRLSLLDRFQSLSLRFHSDSRVGDAIYRMYQDSAMVTQLIEVLFLTPIYTISRFLFSVGTMALFDPLLAVLLALLWPPFLGLGVFFSKRLRLRFRLAREAGSSLTSSIQETLAGIKVIKAYGAERVEQRRFEAASRGAFAAAFEARSLYASFLVCLFWVAGVAMATAGALAAIRTWRGDGIAVAALGFTVWNLGLFNYARRASATAPASCVPSSAPGDGPRTSRSGSTACSSCSISSPRWRTRRTRSRCRSCAAASASATSTSATRRTARRSRASTSRRRSGPSPRSSARPARARRR